MNSSNTELKTEEIIENSNKAIDVIIKGVEENSAEENSAEENSAEENSAEENSAEENSAEENSVEEKTPIQLAFENINNLLKNDVDNKNLSLSIRGSLLIECAKLSLDTELNIHRCVVNNDNTKTISKAEIETWIQSIYDKGLRNFYDKMDFTKFKAFNGKYYSHFESLRDIALAVNFFIGNFHNASKKIDQLPLCKVGTLEGNNTSDLIYTVEEGQFFKGNRVYMRLSFLNSLLNTTKYPIRDKVMVKDNGFVDDASMYLSENKYKLFSVNQIINIANQIINFKEIAGNNTVDAQVKMQNSFDEITGIMNSTEIKDNNEIVVNNVGTPKLLNMIDVYISNSLDKNEKEIHENILKILDNISASVEKNEAFKKHLKENNYIFIVQSFSENSSVPTQINKLLGKKS